MQAKFLNGIDLLLFCSYLLLLPVGNGDTKVKHCEKWQLFSNKNLKRMKSGETENQEFATNLSNIGILYEDKSPAYA